MLTTARDLVRQQGIASLQEVAQKLSVPADVARTLLQKWVDKGRIERLPAPTACTDCALCDSAPLELYHWCDEGSGVSDSAPAVSARAQSKVGLSTKLPSACPAAGPPQGQG
ncbi:FeoC-like transcriptional regulator [Halochromatium sp.]